MIAPHRVLVVVALSLTLASALPAAAQVAGTTLILGQTSPGASKKPVTKENQTTRKKVSGNYKMTAKRESVSGMNLMIIAYSLVWLFVFGYMVILHRVQRRLDKELLDLRTRLADFEAES